MLCSAAIDDGTILLDRTAAYADPATASSFVSGAHRVNHPLTNFGRKVLNQELTPGVALPCFFLVRARRAPLAY